MTNTEVLKGVLKTPTVQGLIALLVARFVQEGHDPSDTTIWFDIVDPGNVTAGQFNGGIMKTATYIELYEKHLSDEDRAFLQTPPSFGHAAFIARAITATWPLYVSITDPSAN